MITLQKVSVEEKSVLRQLLELYQHEISVFSGRRVNEHGFFDYPYVDHYWVENGRYPYFIRFEGQLAGFILMRRIDGEAPVPLHSVAEFFVLRSYQGQGIGAAAAQQLFTTHPGRWQVSQIAANHAGQHFWRKVVSRLTANNFRETQSASGVVTLEFVIDNFTPNGQ